MTPHLRLILGFFSTLLCLGCSTDRTADSTATANDCTLLIKEINIRPMDTPKLMRNKNVRLIGDRIHSITSPANPGPTCSKIIDGKGLFLLPGLNDMHTHLESEAMAEAMGVDYGPFPFDQLVSPYPRYGITGLRLLSGSPDLLKWRDEKADMQPLVKLSGPMLSGNPGVLPEPMTQIVETAKEARKAVKDQATTGYDLIKVRANIAADVHAAIIDEAKSQGLDVEGHLPYAISIEEVLNSGQKGVAHLFELAWAIESGHANEKKVIAALLKNGGYVSTTIGVTINLHHQQQDFEKVFHRAEMDYMHPLLKETFWAKENNPSINNVQIPQGGFFLDMLAKSQAFAVRLNDAGVPLLVGSDALNPMLVHGISFHDELDLLIEGGLPVYDALRAATAAPSEHVPGFEDVGVVAENRIANLLITRVDPMENHKTLRNPEWVIINGISQSGESLIKAYEQSKSAWKTVKKL